MTRSEDNLDLRAFDIDRASEAELRALNAFSNQAEKELWPENPPVSFDEFMTIWRARAPSEEQHNWIVTRTDDGEVVATGDLFIWHGETNQHLANITLRVAPGLRRQGVGSRLLAPIAETARAKGKRLLQAWTTSDALGGDGFMQRIGGKIAQTESVSKLDLSELNRDAVREWLARAEALKDTFDLAFWEGRYPEDEIEAIARLREVVRNSMPRGDAELEDDVVTVERVREWEETLAKQGRARWTAYVRERATRRLAGYTEVAWVPAHPELLHQWDTGVLHEYRNRGIGRWLKAAMIEKVQRERPQVERVETRNSSTNASMLRINHEMGFKPYQTTYSWQIAVDKVFDYLSSREAGAAEPARGADRALGTVDADR